jgi:hypothetical protein
MCEREESNPFLKAKDCASLFPTFYKCKFQCVIVLLFKKDIFQLGFAESEVEWQSHIVSEEETKETFLQI